MEDRLLTTKDVSEQLGVTVNRVQALIRSKRLPAQRLGRDFVIRESDLALVAERKPGRPKKDAEAETEPTAQPHPTTARAKSPAQLKTMKKGKK